MTTSRAKVDYDGSKFWLIFWVIFFFPIALALLFCNSSFEMNQTRYSFIYEGSKFWLCFWLILFCPIAILLFFLNGYSVTVEPVAHLNG